MADNTAIEWTDATWNPVTGCTKISVGCDRCYADTLAERFRGKHGHYFENGFDLTLRPDKLTLPLKWKRPRRIFVNSMSDLFHKDVPIQFIDRVFEVMEGAPQHTFQVLTKRSSLMRDYLESRYCLPVAPSNIWCGVSVENEQARGRIIHLAHSNCRVRFLSLEPLLGPLGRINLDGIHWVIVGGESGPGARWTNPDWVRDIRDQCQAARVPFFFKQWGGVHKKAAGAELDGREWREFPTTMKGHDNAV